MNQNYSDLRKMTREELIREYDSRADHTSAGLGFFREEIARRDAEDQTERMLSMTKEMVDFTKQIRTLTQWIAVLTVLNVILVVWTIS